MSRFPMLKMALVTALALSNVNGLCCYEPEEVDATVALKPGELEAELEACLADDLACETLCASALETRGFVESEATPPAISRCIIETSDVPGSERQTIVRTRYMLPYDCVGGRLPSGACGMAAVGVEGDFRGTVGARLAAIAELEAVSVVAFVELARELRNWRAPESLVRRALRAAADEVDHAAAVAALARVHGAPALAVRRANHRSHSRQRGLIDIALLNATEGCVRELFGALVCAWQGKHAESADARRVFAAIARDELRHAELSFDIAHFCQARISARQNDEVRQAQDRALAELAKSSGTDVPDVARTLGLPMGADAARLAQAVGEIAVSMRARAI